MGCKYLYALQQKLELALAGFNKGGAGVYKGGAI